MSDELRDKKIEFSFWYVLIALMRTAKKRESSTAKVPALG